VAEREGFEPSVPVIQYARLAIGPYLMVGSLATCVGLIRPLRGVGKHGVMLSMFQFGNLPHELVMKSIGLFGREVLPAIRNIERK